MLTILIVFFSDDSTYSKVRPRHQIIVPSSDDENISLDRFIIDDSTCKLTFDDDSLTDVVSSVDSLDWELDDYDSSHSASVSPQIRPKDDLPADVTVTYSTYRICISFTVQLVKSETMDGIMREWNGMLMFDNFYTRVSLKMSIS